MNAGFISQFGYCSLVWIFHSRILNNRKKLQEGALLLLYNDSSSSFSELPEKLNSTIHNWNIQKLAIEIYRVKHYESLKIMSELFSQVNLL